MEKNYYEILDVDVSFTETKIKNQFENKTKELFELLDIDHNARRKLLEISLAYKFLCDRNLNKKYNSNLKKKQNEIIEFKTNCYDVLGVKEDVTEEELENIFKLRVQKLFPYIEINKMAEEILNDIVLAYEQIKSIKSRKNYEFNKEKEKIIIKK